MLAGRTWLGSVTPKQESCKHHQEKHQWTLDLFVCKHVKDRPTMPFKGKRKCPFPPGMGVGGGRCRGEDCRGFFFQIHPHLIWCPQGRRGKQLSQSQCIRVPCPHGSPALSRAWGALSWGPGAVLLWTVINKSCSVWPEGQQQLRPTRGPGAQCVMSAVGVWGSPLKPNIMTGFQHRNPATGSSPLLSPCHQYLR